MTQPETHVQLEQQLMQLDENEQQKVFRSFNHCFVINIQITKEPSGT